ncbi:mitochondrial group I intron splicing factor CCM1 [Scheffersomyces xylosifermentans]|uniref:mitochondrial group I intron splicing factor CCM1 n=1 Tax=Scheffersomyces xylosifermentans TaxID=1304137 RepID=UPI00315C673D
MLHRYWPLRGAVRCSCGSSLAVKNGIVIPQRSIFVVRSDRKSKPPSSKAHPRRRNNDERTKKWETTRKNLDEDSRRRLQVHEEESKRKLDDLKTLARDVSIMVKQRQEIENLNKIPLSAKEPEEDLSPEESDKSATGDNVVIDKNAFIVPATPIPEEISKRLGLALRYLVSEKNQNWPLVLDQLKASDGFKDLPYGTVVDFLTKIPPNQMKFVIPTIEELLQEAQIPKTAKIISLYMTSLTSGTTVSDSTIQVLENYCADIKSMKNGKLPKRAYETLILAHGKNGNLQKIQDTLAEMRLNQVEISGTVLTNILTTCVYKARDHKQAVEIFDTMRFEKEVYKPGTRAYQDIIVSYVNNDDIEKAIDIYREMITEKIEVNQQIMVALARGCASRETFRFKSWDFMFEIYKNKWTPTLPTYEYMMYLSSRDGDLALTRALYTRLIKDNTVTKRSLTFLLLAYSKAQLPGEALEPFLITSQDRGRIFRENVINTSGITEPSSGFPFLPLDELTTKTQIMAESSAIWAHTCLHNPDLINSESTTSYLNIASEMGMLSDFIDRFEGSTYLEDDERKLSNGFVIEEPLEEQNVTDEPAADQSDEVVENSGEETVYEISLNKSPLHEKYDESSTVKSPVLKSLQTKRTPRVSLTYVVALKAAGKFNNYSFANRIWQERGKFRRTNRFKNLSRSEKDKLDFQFASQMVRTLTDLNLLEDALAVLKSTEYQFRWTWRELDPLKTAAVEQGNTKISQTVRGIARRAQVTYEGKIRRKDYKKYVMERGY